MNKAGFHSITFAALLLASASPIWSQTAGLAFSGAREDYFGYGGAYAIGDFNGDGYPDIATNSSGYEVVILLNDGTGHFNVSAQLPGNYSSYFVTGDFNKDGYTDVAFTESGGVYVVLGAGNGTLRTVFETTGGSGGDLKAVDVNGDGILDLVVGGYSVSYFLGNGDGSMQPPISFPTQIESPFAVADLNGDGYPDVVGYNSQAGIVTELNNGKGTFTPGPSTALLAPYEVFSLAAGDTDGNGTVDLALAVANPYNILLYSGAGTGAFTESGTISLPLEANDVALLDTNADGKLDLLYNKQTNSHFPSTNFAIALGIGNGTFASPVAYATAGASERILLADTRKSGKRDLLTGGSETISVLPNQGNGTFTQGSYEMLAGVLQNSVSGDFNGDGIRDLVVSVRLNESTSEFQPDANSQFAGAYVLLGTGNPKAPFATGQRLFVPPDVLNLATADFNKDGILDLAFVTSQDLVIYLGNGDGTFTMKGMYACTGTALTVGDFNGDGAPDIATNGVFLFLGNGDGTFAAPTYPIVAGGDFIGTADLNNDGKLDLIVGLSPGGFVTALGNGDGTFTVGSSFGTGKISNGAIADLNGDGLPDFVYVSGIYVDVYLNSSSGKFKESTSWELGTNSGANTVAIADFNNDGIPDLALPGIGVTVYTGTGTGLFNPGVPVDAADYPNVLVAADFYDFGKGKLPDLIAVGQNGAISFFFNETK